MMRSDSKPHSACLPFPSRFVGIDGPWLSTLIFGPVTLVLLAGSLAMRGHGFVLLTWGFAGLALWSLLEYLFHRFGHAIYHAGRARGWGTWTEGFHWVHHDHPEDPSHFITHPLAVGLLSGIFFLVFLTFLPDLPAALALEGGILLGYLGYEWVHFRAHWSQPGNIVSRYWKHYHLRHHYCREELFFGVTSPLWDWALRPFLRNSKIERPLH
jgi:hypothetical protein